MLELIQHYSNNKNKLFTLFIELLYSFTLLFFASQLYGLELNLEDLLIEVKSISVNFFLTIIGIGLTYLTIAITSHLVILITSLIVLRLTDWVNYQKDLWELKDKVKSSFTFDQYRKQKKISSNKAAHKLFSGLNEKQFPKFCIIYFTLKFTEMITVKRVMMGNSTPTNIGILSKEIRVFGILVYRMSTGTRNQKSSSVSS